ncbi:hypothetical protein [Candidatus Phytoplasma oryzae]|nr:hypothetical protein PIE28_00615 [Candidatus Phytoplasma oryzae]
MFYYFYKKIKKNIKKVLIYFFILALSCFIFYFFINYSNFNKEDKNQNITIIPSPKVEEKKKWRENGQEMIKKEYTFYGLNGIGYYQKELEKEQYKPLLEQNPSFISLYQQRIKNQQEPSDILPFVKKPFDQWIIEYDQYTFDKYTFVTMKESLLDVYLSNFEIKKEINPKCLILCYEGPQYLLNEDKDYYIGKANLSYNPKHPLYTKEYYLHFNPARQTISIYIHQFNTK